VPASSPGNRAATSGLSATAASSSASRADRASTPNWAAITAVSRSVSGSGSAVQRRPAAGSAAITFDSSISASGLPLAWASTCSRARPRGGCGCRSSSRAASGVPNGGRIISGTSRSNPAGAVVPRAASSSTSGSDSHRRAANASASSDAGSSHGASSTATSTGPSSARPDSSVSTAIPVSRASGGTGSGASANAPSSAWACRSGRSGTRSRTGRSNWCSPAKASSRSDSRPVTASTRSPAAPARRVTSASRTVLPMPGSPSRTWTWLAVGGGSTRRDSRDSSLSRPINPMSVVATSTLRAGPTSVSLRMPGASSASAQ